MLHKEWLFSFVMLLGSNKHLFGKSLTNCNAGSISFILFYWTSTTVIVEFFIVVLSCRPSKQALTPTQVIGQKHQIYSRPREVKSPWGVHITSTKPPAELMREMKSALRTVPGCHWEADRQWMYLLHCGWTEIISAAQDGSDRSHMTPLSKNDILQWEMEVCQIPRMHQRGICLKRIRGSAIQFQKIASQVMAAMTP